MFGEKILRLALCVAAALLLALPAGAATITIVNNDGAGEGFNDPTPVSPVGGNQGTTLGQQRLNVFQAAADLWGSILDSNVEIRVRAQFNPLSCDASSAVLGSAGALQVISEFTNSIPNTWYPVALANALADEDLVPSGSSADDLSATFNSAIDNNNNCLAGSNWYLGLDHDESAFDIDLLAVVLHEIGHGLGFASFVDETTGREIGFPTQAKPDIYGRNTFDNSQGLFWDQMSNAQRQASAINVGNVVWAGGSVGAEAPNVLGGSPVMEINLPGAIAGTYAAQAAEFGPALDNTGVTGNVVLAQDGGGPGTATDGCEALTNGGAINGNVALVDRGECNFTVKVANAQAAGALAVIVANNVATGLPPMGGADGTITIPSVGISQADGNAIKGELPGVNVTLRVDASSLAGADSLGRPLLYTPNPVEPGSSVSHWDTSASPNLLMEPFISSDLTNDTDLTDELFQDLGWTTQAGAECGNGVVEAGEVCDGVDLGGQSCGDFGCTGGGTLTCNATCDGFDTSACNSCPVCDFDGVCELGEDCTSCPNDCVGGTTSGAVCGNGICEAGNGEDCASCPSDCNGVQNGKPANRFCCGDGDGQGAVGCGDSRCSAGGLSCTDVPANPGSYCCGDTVCEGIEGCSNCALDCTTQTVESFCDDTQDNDCDGFVDCVDSECSSDPVCDEPPPPTCELFPTGASCTADSQCCSNKCKGPPNGKICR